MSISSASARGAAVFSAVNMLTYAITFIATIAAARLLVPNDFGQAALAIAVVELLVIAAAWSFPTALLREPDDTAEELFSTAIYLGGALNVLVLGIGSLAAAAVAHFDSTTTATILIAVLIGRMFANVGDFYSTDLSRRFAYGRYSLIRFVAQITGSAAMLVAASEGAGPWAVALKDIVSSLLILPLAIALSRWKLRRTFNRDQAKQLLRFARQMIGSRLGDVMFQRYDKFAVGVMSGTATLGLYSQAYLLAEVGNRAYAPTLYQVPMSNYARTQEDAEATTRTYNFINYILLRTVVPLFVILAALPELLLRVLLGPQWAGAADMLRGLAFYALLLPFFEHARGLLIANGLVLRVLRARSIQLAVFLPAVPLLAWQFGGTGAAAGVALAMVVGTVAISRECRALVRHAPPISQTPPLLAGAAAAAAVAGVSGALPTGLLALTTAVTSVVAVYLVVLFLLERAALARNLSILRRNLRRK